MPVKRPSRPAWNRAYTPLSQPFRPRREKIVPIAGVVGAQDDHLRKLRLRLKRPGSSRALHCGRYTDGGERLLLTAMAHLAGDFRATCASQLEAGAQQGGHVAGRQCGGDRQAVNLLRRALPVPARNRSRCKVECRPPWQRCTVTQWHGSRDTDGLGSLTGSWAGGTHSPKVTLVMVLLSRVSGSSEYMPSRPAAEPGFRSPRLRLRVCKAERPNFRFGTPSESERPEPRTGPGHAGPRFASEWSASPSAHARTGARARRAGPASC